MKIVHRIGFPAADSESRHLLTSLGIGLKEQPLVITLELDESSPQWPQVRSWIERARPSDVARTVFTRAEMGAAPWAALRTTWHRGYPQPDENNFGYRRATYDLSDWCPSCGVGMRQVAPFQMKEEPTWGKNSILQLNWVFDEFFTTPELWESVFRPRNVATCPVLGPGGRELSTVVQLAVPETVPIVTTGLPSQRCQDCGRTKYLPVVRGFFPMPAEEPARPMVKTAEYFGSGASAYREVLISGDIVKALSAGVKGATVVPVAT